MYNAFGPTGTYFLVYTNEILPIVNVENCGQWDSDVEHCLVDPGFCDAATVIERYGEQLQRSDQMLCKRYP